MKRFLFIGLTVLVIFIAIWLLYNTVFVTAIWKLLSIPISKENIEKKFVQNHEAIMLVTNYLINSEYNQIHISDSDKTGSMWTGLGTGRVQIMDKKVCEAIDILMKKKGCSVISKDGNTISFQLWAALKDNSRGIVYSYDGNKIEMQFLTKLEPLSDLNWYYYEADYDEWRIQNNGKNVDMNTGGR